MVTLCTSKKTKAGRCNVNSSFPDGAPKETAIRVLALFNSHNKSVDSKHKRQSILYKTVLYSHYSCSLTSTTTTLWSTKLLKRLRMSVFGCSNTFCTYVALISMAIEDCTETRLTKNSIYNLNLIAKRQENHSWWHSVWARVTNAPKGMPYVHAEGGSTDLDWRSSSLRLGRYRHRCGDHCWTFLGLSIFGLNEVTITTYDLLRIYLHVAGNIMFKEMAHFVDSTAPPYALSSALDHVQSSCNIPVWGPSFNSQEVCFPWRDSYILWSKLHCDSFTSG